MLGVGYSVQYRIECAACGAIAASEYRVGPAMAMPLPCPPADWRVVAGLAFCDKHRLTLTVDGAAREF
jgi:hypothetical protein